MFVLWVVAVTVLSVLSYSVSNDLLMSVRLTRSGFVIHCIAYFVGMLLCFLAYEKTEVRGQESGVRGRKDRGRRSEVSFVLWAGLLIFLYSVVLESVQFYLPYRTFNVYDVVANGVGMVIFVVVWVFFISHAGGQKSEVRDQMTAKR